MMFDALIPVFVMGVPMWLIATVSEYNAKRRIRARRGAYRY